MSNDANILLIKRRFFSRSVNTTFDYGENGTIGVFSPYASCFRPDNIPAKTSSELKRHKKIVK